MTLRVSCLACRGACCEEFLLPRVPGPKDDASHWLSLHSTAVQVPSQGLSLKFECRCTKLSEAGRCTIYETRPSICRRFEAGGAACLETIRRRRSEAEQALIIESEPGESS